MLPAFPLEGSYISCLLSCAIIPSVSRSLEVFHPSPPPLGLAVINPFRVHWYSSDTCDGHGLLNFSPFASHLHIATCPVLPRYGGYIDCELIDCEKSVNSSAVSDLIFYFCTLFDLFFFLFFFISFIFVFVWIPIGPPVDDIATLPTQQTYLDPGRHITVGLIRTFSS